MSFRRWRLAGIAVTLIVAVVLAVTATQLPQIGAGGLLHPARRHVTESPPPSCRDAGFRGIGITLHGWQCQAEGSLRGTLVYLHGVADNRTSATGVIDRFSRRGFDVVAYDSRAHGGSEGEACTYGFLEKKDLARVLDTVAPGPVVLVGASLGAAVALQTAAEDARVSAVVAAETFSDLRTVATERAPRFFTQRTIARAFELAEKEGRFVVDDVSPIAAARQIHVPVLLIHGSADSDTPADHSRRVFAGLAGPRQLVIVPGAAHNQSLRSEIWDQIERWIDTIVPVHLE